MRRSLFWLLDHHPETGESLETLYATALAHARLADELGFAGLWLAEHHFQRLGTAPNPAVVLAAMAQCTSRLRLGPAVSVLPLRDPLLVAEDYALVDVLSNGRLDMGVGCGSQPSEFAGLGVDFDARQQTLDRHLEILRKQWNLAHARGGRPTPGINVAPLQSPAPPVYRAAMHDESAHACGLAGDGLLTLVSPLTLDLDEVASRIEAHARGLAAGGHSRERAGAIVVVFAHIAGSEHEAREAAAPALGRFIEAMVGTAPADPGALYDVMRERGTGLFGSGERVAQEMERYAALGIDHLAFVSRFGGLDPQRAERSLRALAPCT